MASDVMAATSNGNSGGGSVPSPSTMDGRIYELAQKVAELNQKVVDAVADIVFLRKQLWWVVSAAIVGPVAATFIQHFFLK